MTQSLLDIVQTILSDIDGDEVNSINDTEEANQVARIVKNNYLNLVSNTTWPHTRRALTIVPYSDSALPTHMKVAENLKELSGVFYNCAKLGETRKQYKEMKHLEPDDFLRKLNVRDNSKTNVRTIIDPSGVELFVLNDKAPEYFTSFDDVVMIFDSYDEDVDDTLQDVKFQAHGYIIPDFNLEDDFIPDLPPDAFSLLINKATSDAQLKLRQMQDMKAESESIKQSRWMSRKSWRVAGGIRYPNYGRK
jgi:hypothetical protein